MIFHDINKKRIKAGHVIRCNGGGFDFYFEVVKKSRGLCARMFNATKITYVPIKYYAGVAFCKCEIIWGKKL